MNNFQRKRTPFIYENAHMFFSCRLTVKLPLPLDKLNADVGDIYIHTHTERAYDGW